MSLIPSLDFNDLAGIIRLPSGLSFGVRPNNFEYLILTQRLLFFLYSSGQGIAQLRIYSQFRPENNELESLIDPDLEHWKKP